MKNRNIILFLQKLRYNLFLNICVFVIIHKNKVQEDDIMAYGKISDKQKEILEYIYYDDRFYIFFRQKYRYGSYRYQ